MTKKIKQEQEAFTDNPLTKSPFSKPKAVLDLCTKVSERPDALTRPFEVSTCLPKLYGGGTPLTEIRLVFAGDLAQTLQRSGHSITFLFRILMIVPEELATLATKGRAHEICLRIGVLWRSGESVALCF
jgi:hypothetical protein